MTAELVEPAEYVETEAHQRISPAVEDVAGVVAVLSKACMESDSTTFDEASDLLNRIRESRKALHQMENGFERWLGAIKIDQKIRGPVQVAGVGSVTVRKASAHVDWDHEGLFKELIGQHIEAHDGAFPDAFELRDIVFACAGIGYWRTGALKEHGVDVSEYRTVTPGRWTVDIQGAS
jgi:hypothetical protein